ncbi:ATP-binding protein [Aquibacillus koreensis]|uniref:histidine kinase n=1 Tax=Aquibacillus koreensis TaxID=279446 RepID=A0A9X3WHQ6_9BACI|nr:ATP-binding protein [Aquibacillus koreensis]MCT2537045.1 ATP-binding protein [Aquibacillus koreensis]MDC3419972.1 ATP-binding protein [Aquibacillus koreensis]
MDKLRLCIFVLLVFGLTSAFVYGEEEADGSGDVVVDQDQEKLSSLDGNWEFYWQQLHTPTELHEEQPLPSLIQVPGAWEGQNVHGEPITNTGYGTYRVRIHIPAQDIGTQKSLSLNYVGSAYRIWIDGKEYEGIGKVGTTKQEEEPLLQRNIIFFEPEKNSVELVMQVSNYSFREGGVIHEVVYGETTNLVSFVINDNILKLFTIGALCVMGLYHFIIFLKRRSELALLFVGLSSLSLAFRTLTVTEYVVKPLTQLIGWESLVRMEYLSEIIFFICMVLSIKCLFPKETHRSMVIVAVFVSATLFSIILFTPSQVFTSMLPYHMFLLVAVASYFVFFVGTLAIIREKEGAILHLVGALAIVFAVLNDVLNSLMIIQSIPMIEYAYILFIMLQAVIVSNQYTRLFKENVTLNDQLTDLNDSLEEKIDERTETIHKKNQELVEMQHTRTRLLANIAHDIGTPIVGMHTYLKIVKEGKVKLEDAGFLDQMLDKLSYIRKLNNDLFDLSKLESHKLFFRKEMLPVNKYFKGLFQSLQEEVFDEKASIHINRFETKIEGKEAFVYLDKWRIRQVLQNYIDNALKFNDSDQCSIELNCYIQSYEHSHRVIIEVSDNGVGIAEEEIPYIFGRFYKKWEGNVQGSGLGLAIVKEIIEQHDGQVGVKSKRGEGSCFFFSLPVSLK